MIKRRAKPRAPQGAPHVRAREPRGESTNRLHPLFSLRHLAAGFRVSDCQRSDKAAFADRLQELAQLTWTQIMLAPRQGIGTETIDHQSVREAIPTHVTPDRTLLAIRFGDKARIIGYREDEVLHIIWIDPEHRVYPG